MMSVQVVPDRFKSQQEKQTASIKSGTNFRHVRRPTRGLELKEDSFATLRVVTGNGGAIKLLDAGSRFTDDKGQPLSINGKRATNIYSNFLIQGVQEERMEKQQILETFGEPYIFLFGERARVITFSGILLNSFDFNWEAEWSENYDRYLRGTRCVENDARVFIAYDTTLVSGYIISSSWTKTPEAPHHVQFQFQLFLTNYTNFSDIGNPSAQPPGTSPSDVPASQDGFNAFRPQLLPAKGDQYPNGADPNTPLVVGLIESGISAINDVWNAASTVVNNVLSTATDILNGSTVRVPYGYAGATVFDNDPRVTQVDVIFSNSVKYTTFDQNDDEYVGLGSQYGSSVNAFGANQVDFEDPDAALKFDQAMVDKAKQTWLEAGFLVPDVDLGPVSKFLTAAGSVAGLGMMVAGSTQAWRASAENTAQKAQTVGLLASGPTASSAVNRNNNLASLATGAGRSGIPGL